MATNRVATNRVAIDAVAINRLAINRLAINRVAINAVAVGRDSAETICLDLLGFCHVAAYEQESQQTALACTVFSAVIDVDFDVLGNGRRIFDPVDYSASMSASSR